VVEAEGISGSTGGTPQAGLTALSQGEYWRVGLRSGMVSAQTRLGVSSLPPSANATVVASSATLAGVYASARGGRVQQPPLAVLSERVGLGAVFLTSADAPVPSVTAVQPLSGLPGSSVRVTGVHLLGASAVEVGGVQITPVTATGNTITVVVPPNARGSAPVAVLAPGGVVRSAQAFTVLQRPTIAAVQPASVGVGSTVTITGTSLNDAQVEFRSATNATSMASSTAAPTVFATVFATVRGEVVSNSTTQIVVRVPSGATTGVVTVITPAGVVPRRRC
jgi:hypothetical protein